MRFYSSAHRFYCGVDLHARTMYLCILDAQSQFLQANAPFAVGWSSSSACSVCSSWLLAMFANHARIAAKGNNHANAQHQSDRTF